MAKVKCKYPTLPSPQSQYFVKLTEMKSENISIWLKSIFKDDNICLYINNSK